VQSSIASGQITTFAVFTLRDGALPFQPASNRVDLRFTEASSLLAGQAGIAVRGTGSDLVVGDLIRTIDGFVVNGVSFVDGAATYTRVLHDGLPADPTVLASGQRVQINGTMVSGEADTVIVAGELLKGPVTAIAGDTLEIAGQSVIFDRNTLFENRNLSSLQVGDFVEVDGLLNAQNTIEASRIEYVSEGFAAAQELRLTGGISNLNTLLKTFTVQNIFVQYDKAEIDDDFTSGGLNNGDLVLVKSGIALSGLTLQASKVAPSIAGGDTIGDTGFELDIEGIITRFVSAQDFDINGQPVATDTNTVFENANTADLTLNSNVEAEGVLDENQVLQASKISIENEDSVPGSVQRVLALSLADERNAFAVYGAVLDRFGGDTRPFANIRLAEASHRDAVLELYDEYDLNVPPDTTLVDPIVQSATLGELCQVGVDAEIANIRLYDEEVLPAVVSYPDITTVMLALRNASADKHLPAFERCAE
jgi:hypothetical protein